MCDDQHFIEMCMQSLLLLHEYVGVRQQDICIACKLCARILLFDIHSGSMRRLPVGLIKNMLYVCPRDRAQNHVHSVIFHYANLSVCVYCEFIERSVMNKTHFGLYLKPHLTCSALCAADM